MNRAKRLEVRSRLAFRELRLRLGLGASLLAPRPGLRIVVYHGVVDDDPHRLNSRFVAARELDRQLSFMREHFHVVSTGDAMERPLHTERLTVAITFDDGYRNNLTLALPLLERYQLPATFFVTAAPMVGRTMLWADWYDLARAVPIERMNFGGVEYRPFRGHFQSPDGTALKDALHRASADEVLAQMCEFPIPAGLASRCQDYWQLLDADELRRLSQSSLVTVGAHGVYHSDLSHSSLETSAEELRSGELVADVIGRKVDAFAFPFGTYTPQVLKLALKSGYSRLFGCERICADDASSALGKVAPVVPRLTMNLHIHLENQMAAVLADGY